MSPATSSGSPSSTRPRLPRASPRRCSTGRSAASTCPTTTTALPTASACARAADTAGLMADLDAAVGRGRPRRRGRHGGLLLGRPRRLHGRQPHATSPPVSCTTAAASPTCSTRRRAARCCSTSATSDTHIPRDDVAQHPCRVPAGRVSPVRGRSRLQLHRPHEPRRRRRTAGAGARTGVLAATSAEHAAADASCRQRQYPRNPLRDAP